jgi:hypothetical protein
MSIFFFYNNLKDTRLINLISSNYTITDGYIYINNYINNKLDIKGNNEQLYGKIVYFNLQVEQILEKINNIHHIHNFYKYTIEKINVNKLDNSVESAYIIY